jgi:YVTN family beta-propeller protein
MAKKMARVDRPKEVRRGLVADTDTPRVQTDTAPFVRTAGLIAVGGGPIAGMSADPWTGLLYVANHVDHSVAVLDPAGLKVVTVVGGTPEPSAVAAAGGRAYVSTVATSYDMISVVDAAGDAVAVRNHPLAHSVRDIAISPGGRYVYAARNGRRGADVAVIDTVDGRVTRMNPRTRLGAAAAAVSISPDGTRVYVATADDRGGELVAIETVTRRVVGGLAFPWPLRDVVAGPDGTSIFVASCDPAFGGVVDIVDAGTVRVADSIDVGGMITDLVVSAGGDRLYVAGGDRISVLCTVTREIVGQITAVAEPSCIAESADGTQLYIADYRGTVTVLAVSAATEPPSAKMSADVIDIPMLELEYAGV